VSGEPGFRFAPGERVQVVRRRVRGHCRTPWYLRGRRGVVTAVLGRYRNPEKLAYHRPGLPRVPLYRVRFEQPRVWPGYPGEPGDVIEADIFEHWLRAERGGRRI